MSYFERMTVGRFDNAPAFPNGLRHGDKATVRGLATWVGTPWAHAFFDDFDIYTAANWVVTETQGGATQAILADVDGGAIALVNSAADNDVNAIQQPIETFLWDVNKGLYIGARFKVSDATQSDLAIGLTILDASPVASAPSDGIYFLKADGAATVALAVGKNGTYSTSGTIATLVDDTYIVLEMVYDPNTRQFFAGANGNPISTGITSVANAVDDENLSCQIALQNGEAVAKTLTVDWFMAAKQR